MGRVAHQVRLNSLGDEASPAQRVTRATVAVPFAGVTGGVAGGVVDLRLGLLGASVVIGWTQLVGL